MAFLGFLGADLLSLEGCRSLCSKKRMVLEGLLTAQHVPHSSLSKSGSPLK